MDDFLTGLEYAIFDNITWVVLALVLLFLLFKTYRIVPQNQVEIVERFGRYGRTLGSGLNFTIPIVEKIAYTRSLKEQVYDVPSQAVITKDNISIEIDGVVYVKVIEPAKSCYGIENYSYAIMQLAQTTMRSEIGKMTLEKTFEERDNLNASIVNAINEASQEWGMVILRYEIKDIKPPKTVLQAMEMQLKADREKRAVVLESEGQRESEINRAEGEKQARILEAQAVQQEQILKAKGQAESIRLVALAQAEALRVVGEEASSKNGSAAVSLSLAEKSIEAKQAIAKESSMVIVPESSTDIASIVAQAVGISEKIKTKGNTDV